MSIKSHIADSSTGKNAQVFTRNGDHGLKVFSAELKEKTVRHAPVVSSSLGTEMAVNAAFAGTPIEVHDGTDTIAWTASAIAGSAFTFNSTNQANTGTQSIEINRANLGNTMQFDDVYTIDLSGHIGLSMFIYVDSNWQASSADSMILYGWDTATSMQIGIPIKLENYFNETEFGKWHKLSILFADMNLIGETVDAFRIQVAAKSSKPLWYIDDFQIEQSGGSAEFKVEAPKETKYMINRLLFSFIDAYDSTLVNNSMPNLAYDKLLGLTSLPIGITVSFTKNGIITFSTNVKNLGDAIKNGANLTNLINDGTNTQITLEFMINPPFILDAREHDKISVIINDDLTGLISFTGIVMGYTEIL